VGQCKEAELQCYGSRGCRFWDIVRAAKSSPLVLRQYPLIEARRRSVLKPLKRANYRWLDIPKAPCQTAEEKNLECDWREASSAYELYDLRLSSKGDAWVLSRINLHPSMTHFN
jgi:hypothetical protein